MPIKTTTAARTLAEITTGTAGTTVLEEALRIAAEAAQASSASLCEGGPGDAGAGVVALATDSLRLQLLGARPRGDGLMDRAARLVQQAWVWTSVVGSESSRSGRARRLNFLTWLGEKLAASAEQQAELALLLFELESRDPLAGVYGPGELEEHVPTVYNAVERAVRGVDSVYRCDDATLAVVLPRCDRANAIRVGERIQTGVTTALARDSRASSVSARMRVYSYPEDLSAFATGVREAEVEKGDPLTLVKLWAGFAAGTYQGSATVLQADARGALGALYAFGAEPPAEVPRTADDVLMAGAAAVVPRAGAGERASLFLPIADRHGPAGVLLLESIHGSFGPGDIELGRYLAARLAAPLRSLGTVESRPSASAPATAASRGYRYVYDGLIGQSPAMHAVFELLERVIETDYPVIVQGESGTGKELIARAIHFNGRRKDKPLIAENCAALNENLLEAELFGYEKGSFTGAETSRKGLFELADGGTLFLDEVADMKNGMQKDLLRILQEGIVRPVGSKKFFHVDVRIICASNRDLLALVNEGKFRADLFYRLNVWSLHMPPLRERREDIPLLVEHFVAKLAQQTGTPPKRLGRGVLDALMSYDWPGNIRELKNEITRMVALAPGEEVLLRDFSRRSTSERERPPIERSDDLLPLEEVEKLHILKALRFTNGNRARAAELLGINKATIYRKLKGYGLD